MWASLVDSDHEITVAWHDVYLQRNNKLVWDETVKIMQGLFNDLWANQDVVSVNHVVDFTLPVGCLIDCFITMFRFVPYPGLYRLHFSLLGLQVCTYNHIFIFSFADTFFRIWKKRFVERGWHNYSSWPYDDLQKCSAHRYQWFHSKADGSWLGVGPDSPTAEGQTWVWRATCASPEFSMFLVHFWGDRCVDVYGGNATRTSNDGREDGTTWSI